MPPRLVAAPPGPDLALTLVCVAVAVGYTALALGLWRWRLRPKPVPAAVGRRYRRWTAEEMRRFSMVLAERVGR